MFVATAPPLTQHHLRQQQQNQQLQLRQSSSHNYVSQQTQSDQPPSSIDYAMMALESGGHNLTQSQSCSLAQFHQIQQQNRSIDGVSIEKIIKYLIKNIF